MTRIVLFTGKGGVGKTTVAAATALRAASLGHRTLVLSTDPAHSLGDALGMPLGSEVSPITTDLWGQQLDAQDRMEASWSEIREWLVTVLDWAGVDAIEAEELATLPGLEEVFALADLRRFARGGEFDLVVVDCAPTAETIRFLSLPDVLGWYMDRLFPASRRINRLVGPVLARATRLPVAPDGVFDATRRFYEELAEVKQLLVEPGRASVRLVVNPERIVIAEARRTFTYLSLFGYRVDAVVANRLLPDDIEDPFFARWKELHGTYLAEIEESFAPLPVLRAPLAADELVGPEPLRAFGAALYGDVDPVAQLAQLEPMRLEHTPDAVVLELDLPFTTHEDLDVARHGDELFVRVGPYRRSLVLPELLRRRVVVDAVLEPGVLRVAFGDGDAGA